jgi:Fe-coproporphyrin III synthase
MNERITRLPILVIFPHSRCNCRCVMCDIWRIRQVREITAEDLQPHLAGLRELQVKWIVFSGGEPLMHSDLAALSRLCRAEGMRLTLLTAGLDLERFSGMVAESMNDVIVSLDGPPAVHNRIRGVCDAFQKLQRGIEVLRELRPGMPIRGRCTIQKMNCRDLRGTVGAAQALSLNSISFLAVDTTSSAFNRPDGWPSARESKVAFDGADVDILEDEVERLISEFEPEMQSGFIVEKPAKLRRIVRRFRARLGQLPAEAPKCNAPWVSAVLESDGTVRPCFFQPSLGNIRDGGTLAEILNAETALRFRRTLDMANDPVCRSCVCSIFIES